MPFQSITFYLIRFYYYIIGSVASEKTNLYYNKLTIHIQAAIIYVFNAFNLLNLKTQWKTEQKILDSRKIQNKFQFE